MKLDPHTTVASLLIAIPSSALVFDRLGIVADGNEGKSLVKLCSDYNVSFERFLAGMDEIDWTHESLDPNRSGSKVK